MTDAKFLSEEFLEKAPDGNIEDRQKGQKAVVLSTENTIVSAGAGSGKTQTLATRFAYLVIQKKIPVEKILTLTFTKKAAGEMYFRIYRTLKTFADRFKEKGFSVEGKIADTALENFSKARIKTLDSYSVEIVRQAANLYGISPDFSVGQKDTSSIIEEKAFAFVVNHFHDRAVKAFTNPGNINDTAKIFSDAAEEYTSLAYSLDGKCHVFADSFLRQKTLVDSGRFSFGDTDPSLLEEFYNLLDLFTEEINLYKRQTGSLTFKDANEIALFVLLNQGKIRMQENEACKYIMIDEFQDNNSDNRDLLFLISRKDEDGKKVLRREYNPDTNKKEIPELGPVMEDRLFFVGDSKQSIYKFRGADVSVFNGLKDDLKKSGVVKQISLTNNYRSEKRLLEEFNELFGGESVGIFPRESEIPYEAVYNENADFPPIKKDGTRDFAFKKRIHAMVYNTSDASDNKKKYLPSAENKIYSIAKKIQSLNNDEKISYGKITILVRSRTHYSKFARIFTQLGIPFNLDQQTDIFSEAAIDDIYTLLRLCVYPADKIAYMSFLCSPFAGIALSDAEEILSVTNETAFEQDSFDKDYNQKYLDAKTMYNSLRERVLSQPVAETVSELWYDYGYRYSTRWNQIYDYSSGAGQKISWQKLENNYNENSYDMLFELARGCDSEGKDLPWFVDQLGRKKKFSFRDTSDIDTKEIDYPSEQENSVTIMTIHKSKGLQFPYVFVYGCADYKTGGGGDSSKLYDTEEYGIVFAPGEKKNNDFIVSAQKEDDDKEAAEFRRLIYVAITRAEKEVYIIGEWTKSTKTAQQPLLKAFDYFYPKVQNEKNCSPLANCEFENIPFSMEVIYPVETTIYNREILFGRMSKSEYEASQKKDFSMYENNSSVITCEKLERFRTSPSKLEVHSECETQREDVFPEIAAIIQKTPSFGKNDFGTLFHSLMENWIRFSFGRKWDSKDFAIKDFAIDERVISLLSSEDEKTLRSVLQKMLDAFTGSRVFAQIQGAAGLKTEYAFKTMLGPRILTGVMDLVILNADGSVTVVDYKTDSSFNPDIYNNQLACYRRAAADLFTDGVISRVNCILYFAELEKEIDRSEFAKDVIDC